jgi:succinate-acetate transporter protein
MLKEVKIMWDVVFIGLLILFFLLAAAFVRGCEKLG